MIRRSVAALSGCALLAALPAKAAVTFEQAKVISNASTYTDYGDANTYASGFGTQTLTMAAPGSVLATASGQADSYDLAGFADATASALEQSRASFANAGSGFIDLAGITSATTTDVGSTAEAYSEGQAGVYTFSVDAASVLTVNYSLTESFTDPYFYNSLYVGASDFSSVVYSSSDLGQNTSGSMKVDLGPGTYIFDAYTQIGDDAYAADGASAFGNHEELYNLNISAAPEPSTWALMIAGIAVMGGILRRIRRRVAALA